MSKARNLEAIKVRTEDKLKAVFDNAAIGIDLLDTKGNFIFVNQYFQSITQYTEQDLSNLNIYDITKKDDLEKTNSLYEKMVVGDLDFYRLEKRYIRKDGSVLWADVSVTPIKNENGETVEIIGVVLDISERKAAQEALSIREREYRSLFDNLRDVFLRMDLESNVLIVSPSCYELTGYTQFEAIGVNAYETLGNKHKVETFRQKLLNDGYIDQWETKIIRKNGTPIWVSITMKLVYDDFGQPIFAEGTIRDITSSVKAENKLKETLSHYRFLIDTMGEGLIKTDKDFNITFVNGAFCNIIGKSQKQIIGKKPEEFVDKSEIEALEAKLKQFDHGDDSFELNLTNSKNKSVPTIITPRAFYTPEGELNGVVMVVTEITKQKSTEIALKESEKKLQEALAAKDKFFSIIAHDMKGPMGNFLGLSKILNKDLEEMTMKDMKEIASSIYDSANSIYKLLEDLLQWSRTQMGNIQFNPEPIDLKEMAFNNFYLLSSLANEKQIELKSMIEEPVYVIADRNMLTTVIRNLSSNGIKFTEPGGLISISADTDDNFATICIEDTGIGMDDEIAENLFKLDSHHTSLGTNAEKGTGLGLVLCKEFIMKHGGRIWVNSTLNKGSKFYFSVPLYKGDI